MKRLKYSLVLTILSIVLILPFGSVSAEGEFTENIIPKMTAADPNVVSGSGELSSSYSPWKAFDGRNDTQDSAWAAPEYEFAGFIEYTFQSPKKVEKYTIVQQVTHNGYDCAPRAPKNWTFEAWDGTKWIVLDKRENVSDWVNQTKKEFIITGMTNSYSKYKLNVSQTNNDGAIHSRVIAIGEIEMMERASKTPDPKPDPQPETGDRAILVVTMTTGLEKEFDLSMTEVNAFIDWYEAKSNGIGSAKFAIDKHNNNKGPFASRKDYVIFDKILTFEVSEYITK